RHACALSTRAQMLHRGSELCAGWLARTDGVLHVMKGMLHPIVASASPAPNTAEPAADLSITLTDYDFQLPQPLAAGRHVVRVENAGAQAHEIAIVALLPGKALRDFLAWDQGGGK